MQTTLKTYRKKYHDERKINRSRRLREASIAGLSAFLGSVNLSPYRPRKGVISRAFLGVHIMRTASESLANLEICKAQP
jgi:hypothetical protein